MLQQRNNQSQPNPVTALKYDLLRNKKQGNINTILTDCIVNHWTKSVKIAQTAEKVTAPNAGDYSPTKLANTQITRVTGSQCFKQSTILIAQKRTTMCSQHHTIPFTCASQQYDHILPTGWTASCPVPRPYWSGVDPKLKHLSKCQADVFEIFNTSLRTSVILPVHRQQGFGSTT